MCPLRCFLAHLAHNLLTSWVSAVRLHPGSRCVRGKTTGIRPAEDSSSGSSLPRPGRGSHRAVATLGFNGYFLTADLLLCSGSLFPGPRPPLWPSSHPTEKAPGGRRLVGNNPDARHFSRRLIQNVNTLPHFRTRAPAKTLKNKLHKHLWGGWSCHITGAATWGGGGRVTSRTQSGTVHKRVNARLTGSGVQENTIPWAHNETPPGKGVNHLKIISELLPAITETIPGLSRRIICY